MSGDESVSTIRPVLSPDGAIIVTTSGLDEVARRFLDTLDRARDLALGLDRALALAPGGSRNSAASDLQPACELAIDLAIELDLFRVRTLSHAFTRGQTSSLTNADDFRSRALERTRSLANELAHDRALDRAIVLAYHVSRALGRQDNAGVHSLAHGLACAVARARARAYDRAYHQAPSVGVDHRVTRRKLRRAGIIVSSADRLLAAATQLLPAAARARYAEEYRNELWDLANCGAGRLQQVQYATRQLARAMVMRSALVPPHNRKAWL